jgi:hypothetical protein
MKRHHQKETDEQKKKENIDKIVRFSLKKQPKAGALQPFQKRKGGGLFFYGLLH